MIRAVTVTNFKGEKLRLDLFNPWDSGLVVMKIDGIGGNKADINTTDISTGDGAYFNSARAQTRNIVFTLKPLDDVETNRHKTYKYFPVKKEVKLEFETDTRSSFISGYVESNEPDIFNQQETMDISILCPDPYFTIADDSATAFNGMEGGFEFEFCDESVIWSLDYIQYGNFIQPDNSGGQTTYTVENGSIPCITGWTFNSAGTATMTLMPTWTEIVAESGCSLNSTLYTVRTGPFNWEFQFNATVGQVVTLQAKFSGVDQQVEATHTARYTGLQDFQCAVDVPEGTTKVEVWIIIQATTGPVQMMKTGFVTAPSYNENMLPNYDFRNPINTSSYTSWQNAGETIANWSIRTSTGAGNFQATWLQDGISLYQYKTATAAFEYINAPGSAVVTPGKTYTLSAIVNNELYTLTFLAISATDDGPNLDLPNHFVMDYCSVFRLYNTATQTAWPEDAGESCVITVAAVKMEEGPRSTLARKSGDDWILLTPEAATDKPYAWGTLEFGQIRMDDRAIIQYEGDADCGMIINIHALDVAENITIYNVDTREQMQIRTDKIAALTGAGLTAGDDIEICTIPGQKYIRLMRQGTYTNILSTISRDADWLMLSNGMNNFAFTAVTGSNNLIVTFNYQVKHEGV